MGTSSSFSCIRCDRKLKVFIKILVTDKVGNIIFTKCTWQIHLESLRIVTKSWTSDCTKGKFSTAKALLSVLLSEIVYTLAFYKGGSISH